MNKGLWPIVAVVGMALAWGQQAGVFAQKADIHDPARAVANLDVHPELQATLFASEPQITNPTNLDIDHRGRVWICDVKNYRGNNGRRPEGDRILILEDSDGDGKADNVKTFYQGRDVDSAMGICVLGNKVIVSASPNVFVFHFDENDKITKREVLFTKTGQPQHDHSAHSFIFGPDGRLYWNFGNTGHAVHDKHGKPVVDLAGNVVKDGGNPYRGGMVFRCDLDGSNFEVLGHNFRNNYEVTVDSFGTMWQSDNDDDGNRGVRINYVMEYGNFGYQDEMTGAGWQTKRTNMEKEIPERHWHLNDPGVVPTMLLTGAGSPCGICVYEGTLLPKVFHGQVIHADAGPSIVRAYPTTKDGAGYKATIVNILDGNKKNNWFRPADVCVAPDGSLFVTDWYDPGVGGHAQRDIDRGRIFRVAPPGSKHTAPKHDFATAEGAVEALKSPNLATRYLAWTALHEMGGKAQPALLKAWKSDVPQYRARALWLLGPYISDKGRDHLDAAFLDSDEDLRIVAFRLARQLKVDLIAGTREFRVGPTSAVMREFAIALRQHPAAASHWAHCAMQHDGKDRWYLEALGIAADKQWDAFLAAYLTDRRKMVGSEPIPWRSKQGRDIIWRSRATKTPELLALIIEDKETPFDDLPKIFRAFDFQKASPQKDAALVKLAFGDVGDPKRQALISGEAVMRVTSFDIKSKPEFVGALKKLLDRTKGSTTFVELVGKFNVAERYLELLGLAQKHPGEQVGVDAMRTLLERDADLVKAGLANKDVHIALQTIEAMGNAAHPSAVPLLLPIVKDGKNDLELRRQATRALGKTKNGAMQLVKLAEAKKLSKELVFAAGSVLHSAQWKDVKQRAAELFPLPAGKNNAPLPLISDLAKAKGNPAQGRLIFAKQGTCANCHIVNGEGKEVGPNLSEIGKKLSKEALYESILYPSAGISHNYETHILETTRGDVVQGILISQTPAEVTLKDKDALLRKFKRPEIDTLAKLPISLMPADLHQAMTTQELVDVVEYMLTLREAKKK
jgi:putative membrane-bound dehydrogenase-like protein